MKLIFVNQIAKYRVESFSIGTLMLSTILKNNGYDVEIVDFGYLFHQGVFSVTAFEESDLHSFGEYLLEESPDVISFYTMCNSYHMSVITAKYIKDNNPNIIIAMGGPQASASAIDSMKAFPWIDLIGLGEGEKTIINIMKAIQGNKSFSQINGVCYRENGNIYLNENNEIMHNLDELPMLDYTQVPNMSKHETISIEVGRGCPFACRYCSTKSFWKRKFRLKSAERIIEEIKYLKMHYGIQKFNFIHDLFTVNKRKIVEFCDNLLSEQLNISWNCSSRVDTLDDETIRKMKMAGCNVIFLGIETGSMNMQRFVNKNLDLDKIWDTIKMLAKYDIKMKISFIYGFPGETLEDLKQTLYTIARFINEGVRDVQLHKLSILCGTEFYDNYYKDLIIKPELSFSDVNGGGSSDSFKDFFCCYPHIFPGFFEINNPELAEADVLDNFISHYHSLMEKSFKLTYYYMMFFYQRDLYLFYKAFRSIIDEKRQVIYVYTDYSDLNSIGFTDEIMKSIEKFIETNYFGELDMFLKNIYRFERDFNRFVFFDREANMFERNYDFDILAITKDKQPASYYRVENTKIRLLRDSQLQIKVQKIKQSFAR